MLNVYSSFSNTNREEMKALPGSVTLYDREPVLQDWSIARLCSYWLPMLWGAYP